MEFLGCNPSKKDLRNYKIRATASQIDNLPAFSKASNMNSPFCKQLSALALVKDNSGNTV